MSEVSTIQMSLANLLRGDPDIMGLLPGGVWTRRIRKNDSNDPDAPVPGSTPEAFDHRGRIRLCASIINGEASADLYGPPRSFYAFPEIWLRCQPHDSEKVRLEDVAVQIIDLLDGHVIPIGVGSSGVCRVVARMGPDDDPELQPAVVDMIRVQIDSVWSA